MADLTNPNPLILALSPARTAEADEAALRHARGLGFDHVLLSATAPLRAQEEAVSGLKPAIDAAARAGLEVLVRLRLDLFDLDHPAVAERPDAFSIRRETTLARPIDPRNPAPAAGTARARLRLADAAALVRPLLEGRLRNFMVEGASGFVIDQPEAAAAEFYAELIGSLRKKRRGVVFIGATPGLPREAARVLSGCCGFDHLVSSLAWWDMKAGWLVEEHEALRTQAPLVAEITPDAARRASDPAAAGRLLRLAAALGAGMIVPEEMLARGPEVEAACFAALEIAAVTGRFRGEMRLLGSGDGATALAIADTPDMREAREGLLVLVNPGPEPAPLDALTVNALSGLPMQDFRPLTSDGAAFAPLAPAETRVLLAGRAKPVASRMKAGRATASAATQAARLVVENLTPAVEGGDFAVKRVIGDTVEVEADVFADGHEELAAEVLWRPIDERRWRTARMRHAGNDRWEASFRLDRLGRHEFTVEGWLDRFGGFRRDFGKKVEAGVATPGDFLEGRALIEAAAARTSGGLKARLQASLRQIDEARDETARARLLRAEPLARAMDQADDRPHALRASPQLLDAERLAARFSSWYELFPRSQTEDKARHGTFADVISRMPAVREMGFDTLYFPPIHPIGTSNRKGPNNTLTPEPTDPGSPYAIGAPDGGHDAIHSELGSFEDFRAMVAAAAENGLEIALDVAINCSPDHPWLKKHPGWFAWRPDGSLKYAENPPKKYQDIVNVDFYADAAMPDLWIGLRDVLLLWVREGVKTFRIDNPHTKPLPYWEWVIGEIRGAHPEVIFLSEAFTKPKVMYRLAKAGFSQSYTYFTWRTTKAELTEYITELTTTAPKEFFRPHFFVNTPDINPVFLQTSGRPGFQIRAALAATLSGLFGVYSGFELCESAPLPGREEYLDSEKFEIRPRDWQAPGNIIWDITLLNTARRTYPALQTHLNTVFHNAWNDNIIFYGKPAPGGAEMILVAINLDPHSPQEADFELPLWEFGLHDGASVDVEDLATQERFVWTGKGQHMRLEPDRPYRLWKIRPAEAHYV